MIDRLYRITSLEGNERALALRVRRRFCSGTRLIGGHPYRSRSSVGREPAGQYRGESLIGICSVAGGHSIGPRPASAEVSDCSMTTPATSHRPPQLAAAQRRPSSRSALSRTKPHADLTSADPLSGDSPPAGRGLSAGFAARRRAPRAVNHPDHQLGHLLLRLRGPRAASRDGYGEVDHHGLHPRPDRSALMGHPCRPEPRPSRTRSVMTCRSSRRGRRPHRRRDSRQPDCLHYRLVDRLDRRGSRPGSAPP